MFVMPVVACPSRMSPWGRLNLKSSSIEYGCSRLICSMIRSLLCESSSPDSSSSAKSTRVNCCTSCDNSDDSASNADSLALYVRLNSTPSSSASASLWSIDNPMSSDNASKFSRTLRGIAGCEGCDQSSVSVRQDYRLLSLRRRARRAFVLAARARDSC